MAVQPALHGGYARDRLDVVIHQRQKAIEVAAVDGVVAPIGELHVLLRHRNAVSIDPGLGEIPKTGLD